MSVKKRKYSLTIISDEKDIPFFRSSCSCISCSEMHNSQMEWESFTPKTFLQNRMKKVVSKIEHDIKRKEKKSK